MTLTPNDITETRRNPGKLTMRFDRDPDTTKRLRRLHLTTNQKLTWTRRLLRWLKRIR